jgi:hypothetical protein
MEAMAEVFEAAVAGSEFRYTAPTNQKRQDLHLRELLRFYRVMKALPQETDGSEVTRMVFEKGGDEFFKIIGDTLSFL